MHRGCPSVRLSVCLSPTCIQDAIFSKKTKQFRHNGLCWRLPWTFQRTHYWTPKTQDGRRSPFKKIFLPSFSNRLSDFSEILFKEAVFFSQNFGNGTDTGIPQNVFFCFPSAVWASATDAFRVVSDTLVVTCRSTRMAFDQLAAWGRGRPARTVVSRSASPSLSPAVPSLLRRPIGYLYLIFMITMVTMERKWS